MRVLAFSGGKDSMACLHLMKDTLDCAIYVDTGKAYPETADMVRYAQQFIEVITVRTDQEEQNRREGIPADIVPINWTRFGQLMTGPKPVTVQSYLSCCFENIAYPLFLKAKELGATELIYGQRNEDSHKATSRNGDVTEGIIRLHPIEDWTTAQVLDYLRSKMEVPAHYAIKHSSLDCYDCTAYRGDSKDRRSFMRLHYPELHEAYTERRWKLNGAMADAYREER